MLGTLGGEEGSEKASSGIPGAGGGPVSVWGSVSASLVGLSSHFLHKSLLPLK